MSIWESLQRLTFEAKVALMIPAILWGISEIRHWIQHRADQQRIQRLEATELREKRAIIQLHRSRGVTRGAALMLGTVVHTGPRAGQHFTGSIKNVGPHMAEDIEVTTSLGAMKADVVNAPTILPPHSAMEPLVVLVPFLDRTYADVMTMIKADELLRVRIEFTDGTSGPRAVEECFAFQLEPTGGDGSGRKWVSRSVPCSY